MKANIKIQEKDNFFWKYFNFCLLKPPTPILNAFKCPNNVSIWIVATSSFSRT
jgi:hypothetical protein